MTRGSSFSVVLSLKSVTGLHRPGDETQILGAGGPFLQVSEL